MSRTRDRRSNLNLDCFGLSDPGRVRSENEDAFFVDPKQGLFLVSDGMGGASAGRLASKIVATVLPLLIRERFDELPKLSVPEARNHIKAALVKLNADIRSRTKGHLGLEGMGATVVLAVVLESAALIAHMGDSRAYRYRKGSLEQLTRDHSLAQVLIEHGEIAENQAHDHPARNRLTRYLGMVGEPLPDIRCLELRPGDRLLLCSDGLTNMINDMGLFEILGIGFSSEQTCKRLVEAANEAGGTDNIAVVHLAF